MSIGLQVRNRKNFVLDQKRWERGCFFLFRNGEEDGPFSFEELQDLRGSGNLPSSTPCRSRAAQEWHDLAYILRESAAEPPSEAEKIIAPPGPVAFVSKVEPMNKLVMDLVGLTRSQNQALVSIRRSLLGLVTIVILTAIVLSIR